MSRDVDGNPQERILWMQFVSSRLHDDRNQLVRLYEPFVKSIAIRMYRKRADNSVSLDDYLQYGRIGLLEAVNRYDSERGVPFSAYSSPRIRGAILNGITKESELAAQRKFWRQRDRERLESLSSAVQDADRASLEEIADIATGLAMGVLLDEMQHEYDPADSNPRNDPYATNEVAQLLQTARRLIERLPHQERMIVTNHYFGYMSFQNIAESLQLSKGRVSQIHAQAMRRLREWLEDRPRVNRKV